MNPLFPDIRLNRPHEVPYEALYKAGFRAVIFDIDNTLVPHGAPADDYSIKLFDRIHRAGFKTVLLSNNREPRVKPFADAVGAEYVYLANKPSKKAFVAALKKTGTNRKTTFLVGDQLFTDILGARLFGIRSVLVKPLHPKEKLQIFLKRFLERPLLLVYTLYEPHRRIRKGDRFLAAFGKK